MPSGQRISPRRRQLAIGKLVLAAVLLLARPILAEDKTVTTQPSTAPAAIKVPGTWEYTAPLISPEQRQKEPSVAQKDPTVVFCAGKWHVFMTVKLPDRTAMEYCSFDKWENADKAPRTILKVTESKYHCAPQVFYFAPHKKWYLVYQVAAASPRKMMWVAYSTTADIADPASWTPAQPMLDGTDKDARTVGGLDYWIICDNARAYLFFTSLNGKLWRMCTRLEDFPKGLDNCALALEGPIFEASHTYALKGTGKYLTLIEENGQRHYKAYLADRLDGQWAPLADSWEKPFAGARNIRPAKEVEAWTDNISHGELIRDSNDQTLTVDPNNLRFVFQGMLEKQKSSKGYGKFAWRIGILTPAEGAAARRP